MPRWSVRLISAASRLTWVALLWVGMRLAAFCIFYVWFASLWGFCMWHAIAYSEIPNHCGSIRRAERPVHFWASLTILTTLGVVAGFQVAVFVRQGLR